MNAVTWTSRCPVCNDILTKKDPQDKYQCQNCGWKEK
jgi:transposase